MNRRVVPSGAVRERASATPRVGPLPAEKERTERRAVAAVVAPEPWSLRDTQLWFAERVMIGGSEPRVLDDVEAARRLTPGPRLTALERFEIYRGSYHARLVECLADDYPVLQHALGEGAFDALCRCYITRHPSRGPNLNAFGGILPSFCRFEAAEPFPGRTFVADLAALEWAIVEVIHAPCGEPLTLEGLGHIPASAWADAYLEAHAAVRLMRFDHPVNAYFQAVRDGADAAWPSPCASAIAIYRSGATVWRMDLTEPMFDVLSALLAREPLGASLERAQRAFASVDPEEVGLRVTGWFREWIAGGLFRRVVANRGG
jgi:hypothetical protein